MKSHRDAEKTIIRRVDANRMEHSDMDPTKRAKLIFLAAAAAVLILLILSFSYAAKARSERNAALAEIEALKQDNAKLMQWLEERTQEVEALKQQVQKLQSAQKTKQKPAQKKKATLTKKSYSRSRKAR